jgi:hypothetical protein
MQFGHFLPVSELIELPEARLLPLIPDPLGLFDLVIKVDDEIFGKFSFELGSELSSCYLQNPFKLLP